MDVTDTDDIDDGSTTEGGLGAWAPSVMPGIGRDLTPAQELACSLRHLDDIGFCESYTGHITWQLPGNEPLLVNPWGLWWAETSASDICTIGLDGTVLEGRWDVTPAFHIHTELHRRRPDARVVIHNHPMYGTLLACTGQLPRIIHQNSAMFADELVFVDEYDGEVASADLGAKLADAMGDASVAVLASHGVLVTGPTIARATYAAANFERCCEIAYRTMLLGTEPTSLPEQYQRPLKASIVERGSEAYWDGAVRQLIAREPDVLD